MTYNLNIPAATHTPAQDQPLMEQNFNQIENSFSINHVPLGTAISNGFHTKVQIPNVISDPNLVSPAASLYLKTAAGASQLFFQNGNLSANVTQLTGNLVTDPGNPTIQSEYTVVTPWGVTLKFGLTQMVASGTTVNFSTDFPNAVNGIIITPRLEGFAQSGANIIGSNSFKIYQSTGSAQVFYFFAWGT